jgi:DedD protein
MAEPAITQDEQRLKQRAMRRLAIALTLIAAAIVALALLDRYNASLRKSEPISPPPRETPEVLPRPPAATPSTPPSSSEEQAKRPPPPPPPVVSNQELPSEPSSAPPATPEPAEKKPAAPSTPGKPPSSAERPAAAAPEQKAAPATAQKPAPASEQKAAPAAEQKAAPSSPHTKPAAPSAAPAPSEATSSNKGFLVQVGVFMSAANARKLQEKLAEKGIPTHTETRIVVGPFKDRAEADAVTRQLKEMGMDGVVIAPPGTQ